MGHFLKKSIPIIVVLLISGIMFFGYNYLAKSLKLVFLKFSQENFNTRLSIGNIGLKFPLCLELKDVKINDSVDMPGVYIYPNIIASLLSDKLIISKIKIIDPVVNIKKENKKGFITTNFFKKDKNMVLSKGLMPGFFFSKVYIQNGTFIYDDGENNIKEFVRIKAKIYFSKDTRFLFTGIAFLKNKNSDFLSPLKIDGVMGSDNVIKSRFHAGDIKLVDALSFICADGLEGVIRGGRVDFKSDICISSDNLVAKCFLKGEDILLGEGIDTKTKTPFISTFILLVDFRNDIVKVRNLQSNFFDFLSSNSS